MFAPESVAGLGWMRLLGLGAGHRLGRLGRRVVVGFIRRQRRQVGRRAVGVDALRERAARHHRHRQLRIGYRRRQRRRSWCGSEQWSRQLERLGNGRDPVGSRQRSRTGGGRPDWPRSSPAVLSRPPFRPWSATVYAPKLTSKTSPRGINHSPATSWLAISGTSRETWCTPSLVLAALRFQVVNGVDRGVFDHDAHQDTLVELAADQGRVPAGAHHFGSALPASSSPIHTAWVTTASLRRQ